MGVPRIASRGGMGHITPDYPPPRPWNQSLGALDPPHTPWNQPLGGLHPSPLPKSHFLGGGSSVSPRGSRPPPQTTKCDLLRPLHPLPGGNQRKSMLPHGAPSPPMWGRSPTHRPAASRGVDGQKGLRLQFNSRLSTL
eukprot:475643-Prorocentrum_minimum.AAC.1